MEFNLVEMWLKKDPIRWVAGALAGAFAGTAMLVFSVFLCKLGGVDPLYPIKIGALPLYGGTALEYTASLKVILTGLVFHEALSVALGVIFAHFTGTNSLTALLGMGLTWATFSWIFINNLFSKSFRSVYVSDIPAGPVFFVCIVFGLSLTTVAFFDRVLRGSK